MYNSKIKVPFCGFKVNKQRRHAATSRIYVNSSDTSLVGSGSTVPSSTATSCFSTRTCQTYALTKMNNKDCIYSI